MRGARDAFLILLGTTIVNQAGYGHTGGTVVLTWIVFGLLCLWILSLLAGIGK
jgi:hypothetical protein